jgi:hypothetical protein
MEPISDFLQQYVISSGKKIALPILVSTYSRLSLIQIQNNSVTFEDIILSLNLSTNYGSATDVSEQELTTYAGMIYEGCFKPALSAKGPILTLHKEMIGNDEEFLKAILHVIYDHLMKTSPGSSTPVTPSSTTNEGTKDDREGSNPSSPPGEQREQQPSFYPILEELITEANTFLKKSSGREGRLSIRDLFPRTSSTRTSSLSSSTTSSRERSCSKSSPTTVDNISNSSSQNNSNQGSNNVSFSSSLTTSVVTSPKPSSPSDHQNGTYYSSQSYSHQSTTFGAKGGLAAVSLADENTALWNAGLEIEKNEPIIRLLAHIRKAGMDILFPQIIHDKVSSLVGFSCFSHGLSLSFSPSFFFLFIRF